MTAILDVTAFAAHELMLFAVVGFLIGGGDDLLIDLIWMGRTLTRRALTYRLHTGADSATLRPARSPGRTVIFVPAWDEGGVIGHMLTHATTVFGQQNYRIYVGCYPNDPATLTVVASIKSPDVRMVVGSTDGPTTKAGCLNTLWRR
jgi:adsorption protein B